MNSIFKVGDVVYTPDINDGRLVVGKIAPHGVHAGTETDFKGRDSRWYPSCYVSFTPWSEPVHVRPLRDGLYVVKSVGSEDFVRRKIGVKWFATNMGEASWQVGDPSLESLIYVGE